MNLGPAIILIIVAAIAGYVLGMVDSRVTKTVKEKMAEPVAEDGKPEAVAKKTDEHVVLKVSVDPALKWRLDLDGMRVEPETMNAEQRTRLVNTVIQIRPWIDAKPATVSAYTPPPKLADAPAAPIQMPAATAGGLPPISVAAANAPTAPPPRVDFMRGVRSLLQNEVKKPEPPLSIVAMIDEVLQKKLAGTPLAEQGIHLEEGSIGEVLVFIGKNRYPGIDAVPDEEIKAIIKSAVAEWGKK